MRHKNQGILVFCLKKYNYCGILYLIGAWWNGIIRVSKTLGLGSIPSAPALSRRSCGWGEPRKIMKIKNNKSLNFPVNDLILFCIHSIVLNSEQCSFERLIKECFTLFPETLKFARYPVWPDSRKLDRPLRALRNEKLIIGDPKTYFILTTKGEERAATVSKKLRQGKLL